MPRNKGNKKKKKSTSVPSNNEEGKKKKQRKEKKTKNEPETEPSQSSHVHVPQEESTKNCPQQTPMTDTGNNQESKTLFTAAAALESSNLKKDEKTAEDKMNVAQDIHNTNYKRVSSDD
jgi:hypothetical protein